MVKPREEGPVVIAGALLKAAFVCCDMVDLSSSLSLADQLTSRYGGGFEMQSWSNLPHGSGWLDSMISFCCCCGCWGGGGGGGCLLLSLLVYGAVFCVAILEVKRLRGVLEAVTQGTLLVCKMPVCTSKHAGM